MNLSAIDLNLLVALDALLAEAHVGRAAAKINLSQPAASHALNRLRHLFGDPLLVRVGARMELTPRALELRAPLTEALHRVRSVLVAETFEPAASSRRFALMLHDHVAQLLVAPLVARARTLAPHVAFDVLPWQNLASLAPDRLRSVDLMVSCSGKEIAGFQRETLFVDTEALVVRRGHPHAARLSILKGFLGAQHVAVVGSGQAEDPVDRWLRDEGVERRIALRVPSYLQAVAAAAQTDLVAFVPKRLAESLARSLSLAILPPPIDPGEYRECLYHPRRHAHDPASLWLRGLVREIVEDRAPALVS